MPLNVPTPEECELEEVAWAKRLAVANYSEKWTATWKHFIEVRVYLSNVRRERKIDPHNLRRNDRRAR